MREQIFRSGLLKVQDNFNVSYPKALEDSIWRLCMKWRESTWEKVLEFVIFTFKPGFNCPLPVPADFKKAQMDVPVDSDYVPVKRDINEEYCTPEEIEALFRPIVEKLCAKTNFRLRTSHINGVFACEQCHRAGCNGTTVEKMRDGCAGYLSEEAAAEIAERFKIEREEIQKKTGIVL